MRWSSTVVTFLCLSPSLWSKITHLVSVLVLSWAWLILLGCWKSNDICFFMQEFAMTLLGWPLALSQGCVVVLLYLKKSAWSSEAQCTTEATCPKQCIYRNRHETLKARGKVTLPSECTKKL